MQVTTYYCDMCKEDVDYLHDFKYGVHNVHSSGVLNKAELCNKCYKDVLELLGKLFEYEEDDE